MLNNPKVSVLIPSYNYANYIEEAIESVLAQTFQEFELIVVDNASTDNTKEIVEKYIEKDSRIKLIINDVNIGMYRNYNKALLCANGEYIKFVNADDKLHEECLEIYVDILDKYSDVSIVTSNRQFIGKKNELIVSNYSGKVNREEALLETLKKGNWIGEPTSVMFRKKNLYSGLFDVSLLMFSDMDMWLRQLEHGHLYVHDDVLTFFRVHDTQGTVYLNRSKDKEIYNKLQASNYIMNSLLFDRFFVNIHDKYFTNYKSIMLKNHKVIIKKIHATKYWKSKYFYIGFIEQNIILINLYLMKFIEFVKYKINN